MYHQLILLVATSVAVSSFPLGEFYSNTGPHVFPHRAVEINAEHEALLPRELLKSRDFYDNPVIAERLAKESWFTSKESPVIDREAEKIPREQIYKLIKGAGFLDKKK